MSISNPIYKTIFRKNAPPNILACINYFKYSIFDRYGFIKSDGKVIYHNFWVAGGALRSFFLKEPVNDFDLYFPGDKEWGQVSTGSANIIKNSKCILDNERVTKLRTSNYNSYLGENQSKTVDLVKIFYPDPVTCLENFDFTVCAAAVTPFSFIYHENFFIDNLQKRLVLNCEPKSMASLQRLQKYNKKGYFMDNENLIKLGEAINKFDLTDPKISVLELTTYPGLNL